MNELKEFLIEAKKQTYANGNAKKMPSTRDYSIDYEYSSGKMKYHDTYFGGLYFIGEEIVYQDNVAIWGMNYRGETLDLELSEDAMDKALRPALMMVGSDDTIPVRGPKSFINGEFEYQFNVVGDLDSFIGEEVITKNGNKVYTLKCHGGKIIK